jgi:hypothetical protein
MTYTKDCFWKDFYSHSFEILIPRRNTSYYIILELGGKYLHARENLFTSGKTSSRGDVIASIDKTSRNGTSWSVGDVARYVAVGFSATSWHRAPGRKGARGNQRFEICRSRLVIRSLRRWDSCRVGLRVLFSIFFPGVKRFFASWRGFSPNCICYVMLFRSIPVHGHSI